MPTRRVALHLLAALAAAGLSGAAARAQGLVINEVMSSNRETIRDENGESSDWIEVYNPGPAELQLEGHGLSDDADPLQWVFPAVVIPPGGHTVVFCSGEDRTAVPSHWETVITQGDAWRYIIPAAEPPAAWRGTGFNDAAWSSGPAGFGYGDGDDRTEVPAGTISVFARKTFRVPDPAAVLRVFLDLDFDDGFVAYLNGVEVARENIGTPGAPPPFDAVANAFTEPRLATGGELFHYREDSLRSLLRAGENVLAIQVHNNAATSTDLSLIPFLTLGLTHAPPNARGADDLIRPTLPGLHASFKLLADGETITLASPSGDVLDSVAVGALPVDVSMGRFPDGTGGFSFHSPATPGAANVSAGYAGVGGAVAFSHQGGFHAARLTLTLSKADAAGEIFVTTDGSAPTESSPRYTTPLDVRATSVVRARTLGPSLYPGATATHTFIIGSRSFALPVVSISTDPANFFDDETGIYVHGTSYDPNFPYFGSNFWEDWERPVHLELYERGGALGFSLDAGAKIFGGWSRGNPQRSLSFFARSQYGARQIDYRFFPEKDIDSFEGFVLRNSGNDWQITHFRDDFMTSLVAELGIDLQAYRPAAVFINGQYWGLYSIREKVNEHYLAANHPGVRADQVDLLEANGWVIHGDAEHYQAMLALLQSGNLQDPAVYAQIESMVDLEDFIDYQAAQIYFDNTDWPGNNIKFWRPRVEGGRWRWILFDTDFGFGIWNAGNYVNNTLAFALEPNGPDWPNPPWSTLLLRRLVTSPRFVEDFVNRFATHLSTIFVPARVVARIDSMARAIESEMPAQRARWGSDVNAWRSSVQVLRDFANRRISYVRSHLASRFRLGAQAQLRIALTSPGGIVAVQGIPIRAYPYTGTYFRDLPIRLTAVPDPGYRFTGWTGIEPASSPAASVVLTAASLEVSAGFELDCAAAGDVVINEIEYNAPADADPGDWVELHNRIGAEVDLGGWSLADAAEHAYTIPAGTRLAAGGYLVLCSSTAAFSTLHPAVGNRLGDLGFSLAGGGETVRLLDASAREVDSVTYGDSAPWPAEPDGGGATLALKNPLYENSHAPNWAASLAGGTPGASNDDVLVPLEASCEDVPARFLRGDCDADGALTIADPVRLLLANFAGATVTCWAACDANGDGATGGVTDALHLLRFLFTAGPTPVAPFPACGAAPLATDADLGCEDRPASCP